MQPDPANAAAKTHPASREILPDDPLALMGLEVQGSPDLMLRMLVEEYARIGWGVEAVMQLAGDPNYQAFHGLLRMLGETELRRRVEEIISRCGVMKIKVQEMKPAPSPLVQLE